jgi:hypothetical protein
MCSNDALVQFKQNIFTLMFKSLMPLLQTKSPFRIRNLTKVNIII